MKKRKMLTTHILTSKVRFYSESAINKLSTKQRPWGFHIPQRAEVIIRPHTMENRKIGGCDDPCSYYILLFIDHH